MVAYIHMVDIEAGLILYLKRYYPYLGVASRRGGHMDNATLLLCGVIHKTRWIVPCIAVFFYLKQNQLWEVDGCSVQLNVVYHQCYFISCLICLSSKMKYISIKYTNIVVCFRIILNIIFGVTQHFTLQRKLISIRLRVSRLYVQQQNIYSIIDIFFSLKLCWDLKPWTGQLCT